MVFYCEVEMTLQEYLRKKQIKEEATRAAKESVQKILGHINKDVRGEHEKTSVHYSQSRRNSKSH